MKEQENVLYVRMLGGFSLRWNGKLVAGGSKASDSQNASLLQLLIHEGEKGVSRDRLEELLSATSTLFLAMHFSSLLLWIR